MGLSPPARRARARPRRRRSRRRGSSASRSGSSRRARSSSRAREAYSDDDGRQRRCQAHGGVAGLWLSGHVAAVESFASILSCSGAIANGELVALTAARARRTYPRFAGTFTFAETIQLSPDAFEQMIAFVRATGWQGIFQTDTLETNDGRLALIDFNPRLFSSMSLDIAAGANLPAVWCDWLLNRDPPTARARAGFRYRWEEGEVRAFADYVRRRRLRAAASVLRPRRRTTHAFLSIRDPAPFCLQMLVLTRRAVARALRAATKRERGN